MKPETRPASVGDILQAMEQWAPAWTAEDWDRVGLMVGRPDAPARQALTALELTPDLVDQALKEGIDMILVHHPPIFKPLKSLRTDHPRSAMLLKAAAGGLAVFAAHTNLDAAPGGVNDALAQRLGLRDTRPLAPAGEGGLAKLVVFVPPEHREAVAQALFAAGAGRIGAYSECAFRQEGTGSFRAPEGSRPWVGQPGQAGEAKEERLETLLPMSRARAAVAALLAAHPYEEPAWDLYPLGQAPAGHGLGRVGELAETMDGKDFAAQAARELGAAPGHVAGPLPPRLKRVAVLGGSGGDFLPQAAAAGAQVLVTGEAGYHAFEAAEELGVGLVVLGHYQTEAVIIKPWARRLSEMLADAGLFCTVRPHAGGVDPWRPAGLLP